MKVLIIDDSGAMRLIISNALKSHVENIEIDEADDGETAIPMLEEKNYDIILVDWIMPNMNGIEFVKYARSIGIVIPIIMITTEGQKSKIIQALKTGINDFIIKPFKTELLIEKFEKNFLNYYNRTKD